MWPPHRGVVRGGQRSRGEEESPPRAAGDEALNSRTRNIFMTEVKGKVFPYSLPSVGPGADPGVQAVSLQVT